MKRQTEQKQELTNEEVVQISGSIPKSLYRKVKIGLLNQEKKMTMSKLLDKTLTEWVNGQNIKD